MTPLLPQLEDELLNAHERLQTRRGRLLASGARAASLPGPRLAPIDAAGHRGWSSRWLIPVPIVAALIAAIAFVALSTGGGPSIVARAYAAISGRGVIVHYVQVRGGGPVRLTIETWLSGSRRRTDTTTVMGQNLMRTETTIDGDRYETYVPKANTLIKGPAGRPLPASLLGVESGTQDPLDVVRHLYRSGQLHAAGNATLHGRRVDVIAGHKMAANGRSLNVRVLVDPRTFVPLELQMTWDANTSSAKTSTTTITGYRHLTLTNHNRRLLMLAAHPDARVIYAPCGWMGLPTPHGLTHIKAMLPCPRTPRHQKR